MKTITLKSISIRNFKGIEKLDFDFASTGATISGDNATGKTTIMDSFLWLLFGKDSTDRKDFEIIPLDANNNMLEKVDSEVSAVLDEDGAEITLKRVHHQKWVKPRGSESPSYQGNETKFWYNGVPQKATEYKQKIESIVDEKLFKLITNPLYFNSIPWQERRQVLTDMAGTITTEDVMGKLNKATREHLAGLAKNKSHEDHAREIAARKKNLKTEMDGIPIRIDELHNSMPDQVDEKAIKAEIEKKEQALSDLDQQIADANKVTDQEAETYRMKRHELNELKDKAEAMLRDRRQELQASVQEQIDAGQKIMGEVTRLGQEIESKSRELRFEEGQLKTTQERMEVMRKEWAEINAEELSFNEDEFKCPTCGREYDAEDNEVKRREMADKFNTSKRKRLEDNNTKGIELKGEVDKIQARIKELGEQITSLQEQKNEQEDALAKAPKPEVPDAEKDLAGNLDYQDLLKKIEEAEQALSNRPGTPDISTHTEMKRSVNLALDGLKKQIAVNESREKAFARIEELKSQEKDLSQQLADLEKTEFAISEFKKAEVDLIEERTNKLFSTVRFKMFRQNINGSEEPTCETLINGVPFSDANNAAKINAGIDIVNSLSLHYGVKAPIIIDNAEAVTELLPTGSQVIRLVVTTDQVLTLS